MRKILLSLAMCCFTLIGYSQYYYVPHLDDPGNPGGINQDFEYPVGGGLDPSWIPILGPSIAIPTWSSIQNMPFPFSFNGASVTSFKVSSTGVLTFDVGAVAAPPSQNFNLPNSLIPDKSICIWGLTGPGGNDNIVIKMMGNAPNRQAWISFSSYNYEGGSLDDCWHYYSIVIEEGSNKIFIVDQRHAPVAGCVPNLTMGIQIDENLAYEVAGSPNITPYAGSSFEPVDNNYWEFVPGTLPKYDLSIKDIDVEPILLLADAPFDIEGSIFNSGSETITNFKLNYRVNGGAIYSATINAVSIASFDTYAFTHPIAWTPSKTGDYSIEVWASAPNGFIDQIPSNDRASMDLSVIPKTVDNLPVFESFTSSTSPASVGGGQQIDLILGAAPPEDYALISYQMSWPGSGDPYFTQEGNQRRSYYGVSFTPAMRIDGQTSLNTNSLTQTLYDDAKNAPSVMQLYGTHTVDVPTKTVTGQVLINPMIDIPAGAIAYIIIVEDTTFSNVRTNGQLKFPKVMKKMVPDASGTILSAIGGGTVYKIDYNYTFQGSYRLPADATNPIDHAVEHSVEDFNNLRVVALVQDPATGEIFQTTHSSSTCLNNLGFVALGTAQNTDCADNPNGSMGVAVTTGGTAPFSYDWSNGDTTQAVPNVIGGTYSVMVTDADGCKAFASVTVAASFPAVDATLAGSTLDCPGDSDGSINMTVTAGTSPYTYLWSNGSTTQDLMGEDAGNYSITITDANGCTGDFASAIVEPEQITFDTPLYTPDNGSGNGTATAPILGGGTAPYQIEWNTTPVQTGQTATGLTAGTYTATATDAKGCTNSVNVTVASSVSIDDELAAGINALNVYPNPSTGQFALDMELQDRDDLQISIRSLSGQLIYSRSVNNVSNFADQIRLPEVSAGLYLLVVTTSKGQASRQLMIK